MAHQMFCNMYFLQDLIMLMATLVCPALALCCACAQITCDAHSLDLDSSRRQCYSHIHTFVVVDDFEIQ
jgi:hypothetical protein